MSYRLQDSADLETQVPELMRRQKTHFTCWRTICLSILGIIWRTSCRSRSYVSSSLSWERKPTHFVGLLECGRLCPAVSDQLLTVAGDHTRTVTIATPTTGGLMGFVKKTLTCLACRAPIGNVAKGMSMFFTTTAKFNAADRWHRFRHRNL